MRDWKKYWDKKVIKSNEKDFFKQVDRTEASVPVIDSLIETQDQILKVLKINSNDNVLDLCCGNGIVTQKIAELCNIVVGVDYSESLINIAKKYFNSANVSYFCLSVLDKTLHKIIGNQFSKIFMLGSLQFFEFEDFAAILSVIRNCSRENSQALIEGIPDIDRIWEFFNTEERRAEYRRRKDKNEDIIGTWWNKEEIIKICNQNNFACQILPATDSYAHYRFDVKLSRLD